MSKTSTNKTKESPSAYASQASKLPLLAFAWIGLILLTAIAALCPRFTLFYAIYIVATLGLALGSLAFLRAIYNEGKAKLLPAFKKFLGYGLVLHYAAAALPRVDWANSGAIGSGSVTYLFILALLCLIAGIVLFIFMGRPSTYAAFGLIGDDEVKDKALRKERAGANRSHGLIHGILEWVDALGFAAILVILLQTFVFQLYEIPSESMVPAFLIKDRPFTSKFNAGPRIPLTDWRLPWLRLPQRGDIITMANPRYPENQTVNLKKYLAQFVSMITFTAVNIDSTLPDGSPKADPLVKRVVGVPGDKLMMVDDVLYVKHAGDQAFAPIEVDKTWAHVDLWKDQAGLDGRIKDMPIDEKHRAVLDAWDKRKRDADPKALVASISASLNVLVSSGAAFRGAAILKDLEKTKPEVYKIVLADIATLDSRNPKGDNPITALSDAVWATLAGARLTDLSLALSASTSASRLASLKAYAASSAAALPAANAYERSGRIMNLLVKENFLARAARESQLAASGVTFDILVKDGQLQSLIKDSVDLAYYVNGQYEGLYDERNFPEFPAGDQYLKKGQYFAMGDNRYNSLDFRYLSGNYSWKTLDPADPAPVLYYSNIEPFALDLKFIEGYALFRVWPPSRVGAIR